MVVILAASPSDAIEIAKRYGIEDHEPVEYTAEEITTSTESEVIAFYAE